MFKALEPEIIPTKRLPNNEKIFFLLKELTSFFSLLIKRKFFRAFLNAKYDTRQTTNKAIVINKVTHGIKTTVPTNPKKLITIKTIAVEVS